MTDEERRKGMDDLLTDIAVMRQRQFDFEQRFDRHEEGEFARYDAINESIKDTNVSVNTLSNKLSGMNGWMLGFGAACAAVGAVLSILGKKLFGI